jgi:hypothetical protein
MLLSNWGVRLLSLGPFGYKIYQGLGLDCCLGHIGYVEPHELECPFEILPVMTWFPIISPNTNEVTTWIGWLSK